MKLQIEWDWFLYRQEPEEKGIEKKIFENAEQRAQVLSSIQNSGPRKELERFWERHKVNENIFVMWSS